MTDDLVERLRSLKDAWRAINPGGCQMLSLGDKCPCALCVIDGAIEAADALERARKRETTTELLRTTIETLSAGLSEARARIEELEGKLAFLEGAVQERFDNEAMKRDLLAAQADARQMRSTLQELRLRYHAAGRRPEECYEMSAIDAALAGEPEKHPGVAEAMKLQEYSKRKP